ncbi:hypothetical protein HanPI659440_Chr01g0005191 [Helianthus annuus]|nr:hypothetical protein HanPI659440_Chr01g0005191 [Helianthus annuus]
MLVWSSTSLYRFFDHDHLVVTFFTSLKLALISLLTLCTDLIIYLFVIDIKSALLGYDIKAVLTQSCVKIMVHKFISFSSVLLNGSFSIDRTFCDIYCSSIFDRKTLFTCFVFN